LNFNISERPGLYIHIPFCEKKCPYCDFYSLAGSDKHSSFVQTLGTEITLRAALFKSKQQFDTIYFGGGTPSILSAADINFIIQHLKKNFPIADNCEITLEMNPGTVDSEKIKEFKQAGINRISLGVQSFNDNELKFLGRIHNSDQAEKTINQIISAGFENFSLDFIYALPGQSRENWSKTLNKAFKFNPKHISAYNLIVEEETPFYTALENNKFILQDEIKEADFFRFTVSEMQKNGFEQYETSSFAKGPQFYSRHNYKYWIQAPYLGFGPSAHSFWSQRRWNNVRSLDKYLAELNKNELPEQNQELLETKTILFEYIFLALRTTRGLNLSAFKQKFNFHFTEKYFNITEQLINKNLAEISNNHFRLTLNGLLLSDEILPNFI